MTYIPEHMRTPTEDNDMQQEIKLNALDIENLQSTLLKEKENKHDYVMSGNHMTFDYRDVYESNSQEKSIYKTHIGLSETSGGGIYKLSDHANMQIANRFDIPVSYFNRMKKTEPDLLKANVNWWMRRHSGTKKHMVRTIGDTARAFVSNKFNNQLDNIDVLNTVLEPLSKIGLKFRNSYVTETRMYLRGTLPNMQREIKSRQVGDIVELGILIQNSEVGLGSLLIMPIIMRLACLNGMKVNDKKYAKSRKHVGMSYDVTNSEIYSDNTKALANQAWLSSVNDEMNHIFKEDTFDEIVDRLNVAANSEEISDPEDSRDRLVIDCNLTEQEGKKILDELYSKGDGTQWGMANAITATAQKANNADRSMELEEIGWNIANLHENDWHNIAEAVITPKEKKKLGYSVIN